MDPKKCSALIIIILMIRGLAFAQAPMPRPLVRINTTMGTMIVALYNETPAHRDRFLGSVREHLYDSTLVHRVVPGLMLQGGDLESKLAEDRSHVLGALDTNGTLPAEFHPALIHKRGALGATRREDGRNPERRSDPEQFYIVLGDRWEEADLKRVNERRPTDVDQRTYAPEQAEVYAREGGTPHLDGAYTIFGEVVEGFEVLEAISTLECDAFDRPWTDVRLWMNVIE